MYILNKGKCDLCYPTASLWHHKYQTFPIPARRKTGVFETLGTSLIDVAYIPCSQHHIQPFSSMSFSLWQSFQHYFAWLSYLYPLSVSLVPSFNFFFTHTAVDGGAECLDDEFCVLMNCENTNRVSSRRWNDHTQLWSKWTKFWQSNFVLGMFLFDCCVQLIQVTQKEIFLFVDISSDADEVLFSWHWSGEFIIFEEQWNIFDDHLFETLPLLWWWHCQYSFLLMQLLGFSHLLLTDVKELSYFSSLATFRCSG